MKVPEIKQLPELIRPYLGQNSKVVDHKIEFLTSPGENYGSIIVAVDVTVLEEDTQKVVSLVAKLNPLNEFVQQVFQTHITFKKEIFFYTATVPSIIKFQREQKVPEDKLLDVFPKCYGGRVNLNPKSDAVDEDAVVVLENLKILGYYVADRFSGYDLEKSEFIIRKMAQMQAVFVSLKILKPDEFKENILPALTEVRMAAPLLEEKPVTLAIGICRDQLKSYGFDNEFIEKAEVLLKKGYEFAKDKGIASEPFASIVHNDLWVNNIMILEKDGRIVKTKFVDYQTQDYGSPMRDLLFFLFTSADDTVLHNNFDDLIDLYYRSFIETLEEVSCDTAAFSQDLFRSELDEIAQVEFTHIVYMLRPIFAIKGTVKEVTDFSLDDVFDNSTLSDTFHKRFKDVAKIYGDKGWL